MVERKADLNLVLVSRKRCLPMVIADDNVSDHASKRSK